MNCSFLSFQSGTMIQNHSKLYLCCLCYLGQLFTFFYFVNRARESLLDSKTSVTNSVGVIGICCQSKCNGCMRFSYQTLKIPWKWKALQIFCASEKHQKRYWFHIHNGQFFHIHKSQFSFPFLDFQYNFFILHDVSKVQDIDDFHAVRILKFWTRIADGTS